jgi:hypothetical protein
LSRLLVFGQFQFHQTVLEVFFFLRKQIFEMS